MSIANVATLVVSATISAALNLFLFESILDGTKTIAPASNFG